MHAVTVRNSSAIAAVLLGVLTLAVFAAEQNQGPESAVRRFQKAVLDRNIQELQRTVVQPIGTPSVADLQVEVTQLHARGAYAGITRTTRFGAHVTVDAGYRLPNGEIMFLVWILKRDRGRWKVDADLTREFAMRSLGVY